MSGLTMPFPWPGRKTGPMAAPVLAHFAMHDPHTYVEPFAGAISMLLQSPIRPHEVVNDLDGLVVNMLRSVRLDPVGVALAACAMPVSEVCLQANFLKLQRERATLADRMAADPDYCVPQLAGIWIAGQCSWIGDVYAGGQTGPWLAVPDADGVPTLRKAARPGEPGGVYRQIPHLCSDGAGIHRQIPHLGSDGAGIHRQIPHLGPGRGIQRKIPHLGNDGKGIHRQIPHLSSDGTHAARVRYVVSILKGIRDRLTDVKITCGDWRRVLTPAATRAGRRVVAYFDPPYATGTTSYHLGDDTYHNSHHDGGGKGISAEVRQWCMEHDQDPLWRMALAGRGAEHDDLLERGWTKVNVAGPAGYNRAGGAAKTECHWLSPAHGIVEPKYETESLF